MKCVVKNNSSMDMGPILPLLKSLLPYTRKKLGFNRPPSLFFTSDAENAAKPLGKTAFYDPAEVSITVFVDGRHPKDILRSISHELVHHMQHERGDFGADMDTGEGYAQKNDALRELEREAYESGNMCFRDWEDENRKALQEVKKHFNKENEKMSAKKKRNNNVESLLMKKWGFKEQTRQEFNIEVPDAKKSVLSEDLARHIVKEAIKKAGKTLIKEQENTDVDVLDLRQALRSGDPSVRDAARKTFSNLFNSGNAYNKDIAIKSIPRSWSQELGKVGGFRGEGIDSQWYFRQKGIFDNVQDILDLDPQSGNKEKRDGHIEKMGAEIDKVSKDIDASVQSYAADRMKPFGLDAYGQKMAIDRPGGKEWLGFAQDDLSAARNAWSAKKKELGAQEGWEDKSEEDKASMINNQYREFVKNNPVMQTQLQNPSAAVNPMDSSLRTDALGPGGVRLLGWEPPMANVGTGKLLKARYNQLVANEKIDGEKVTLQDFANKYTELVSGQEEESLANARARAELIRNGLGGLYSRQTSTGLVDPGQLTGVGNFNAFGEVYASDYGKVLDGNFSAGDQKIFDLVKDKWEGLDEKPSGDDLGAWLTNAKEEAVGQIGDPKIYNTRKAINDVSKYFVPDYTEDLTGRARTPQEPEELGVIDTIKQYGSTVVPNIKRLAGVANPFGDGTEGAYEDWAADELRAGRTVVPYDEYTGYRGIMDSDAPRTKLFDVGPVNFSVPSSPKKSPKVPQGVQNEDLIRKVVQEALKRKFGE